MSTLPGDVTPTTSMPPRRCARCAKPIAVFDEADSTITRAAPKYSDPGATPVGEELLGEEPGQEQPAEQRMAILPLGETMCPMIDLGIHRVRIGGDVGPVHGGMRLPMCAVVAETILGGGRREDDVRRHRIPPVEPAAQRDVICAGLDHGGPPHRRDTPERFVSGREEVPVAEHVAEHGVGDVVRSDREPIDPQADLAWFEIAGIVRLGDESSLADRVPPHLEGGRRAIVAVRMRFHPTSMPDSPSIRRRVRRPDTHHRMTDESNPPTYRSTGASDPARREPLRPDRQGGCRHRWVARHRLHDRRRPGHERCDDLHHRPQGRSLRRCRCGTRRPLRHGVLRVDPGRSRRRRRRRGVRVDAARAHRPRRRPRQQRRSRMGCPARRVPRCRVRQGHEHQRQGARSC